MRGFVGGSRFQVAKGKKGIANKQISAFKHNIGQILIRWMALTFNFYLALSFALTETLQIVGLCQALNDVLDSMAKKGLSIPVWSTLMTTKQSDLPLKSLNYSFACYFLSIGLSCLPRSEVIWHHHGLTNGDLCTCLTPCSYILFMFIFCIFVWLI